MLWLLLTGCALDETGSPYASGGQAVGSHYSDNGGGDDTADSGGTNAAAPEITDLYMEFSEAGSGFIIIGHVVFVDAQDDVAGGKLFLDVTEGNGDPTQFTIPIVAKEDLKDATSQSYIDEKDGEVSVVFAVGPVDSEKDYLVDNVQIKDVGGNTSNAAAGEVAAGSYVP